MGWKSIQGESFQYFAVVSEELLVDFVGAVLKVLL